MTLPPLIRARKETSMKLRWLGLAVLFLFAAAPSRAQTTLTCTPGPHCVGLSWAASADAAANPTLGYEIYRLNGACPATPPATVAAATGFQLISGATPLTVLTYIDNGFPLTPLPPGLYCYFAVSVLNGAQSVPSNLVAAVILPAPPTGLTGAVK